ncbi:hypothetical protein HYW21_02930 [Candidatus Woesearchaeota archaeon]|nr:hypothetical protein [Candidatus Woesearchaeota archaeon]
MPSNDRFAQPGPSGPPIDQVINMRQQGFSNNQIVQTLRQQGFAPTEIFDAMNQADIKGSVEEIPAEFLENPPPEQPMQMQPEDQAGGYYPPQPQETGGNYYAQHGSEERIEELAEAIIDEKWEELVKSINKMIEWKDKVDIRISKLEQEITDVRAEFDKVHQAIIGKIGDYDKNIVSIGTEIKAMEKVFQKVLPTFTENVNELNRITKNLRQKGPPEE